MAALGARVAEAEAADPTLAVAVVAGPVHPLRTPFRGEHDMVQFMRAASTCEPALLDQLLLQLGNDGPVTDKLREIVAHRFDVSTGSFQQLALPLLQLVASRPFLESIHNAAMKRVLRVLRGEPWFFRRVRNCLQQGDTPLEREGLMTQSVSALASVLNAIVRKLPDSATDEELYEFTEDTAEWVRGLNGRDFAPAQRSLADTLEICYDSVPSRRPRTEPGETLYLIQQTHHLHITQRGQDPTMGFAHGPRHDNDDANFHNVRVIPTDLEMRSLEPPHLPTQLPIGASMESRLDFHFRLLRQDVLAQIRRGVQWALRHETLAVALTTQQWRPPREANIPLLNVAMDARLERLEGSIYKGVMFVMSAAQPPMQDNSAKGRRAFWKREERYRPGSLVCIASNVDATGHTGHTDVDNADEFPRYASLGAAELIFATVADNDLENLVSDPTRFSIRLKLLETDRTATLTMTLTNPRHRNLMLEVRGLFFTAYEPILRTLQLQDTHSLTEELQACLFGDVATQIEAWRRPPAYARAVAQYNLQSLVQRGVALDLSHVRVDNASQLRTLLLQHESSLSLDTSQIDAFASALTQQVCLIQGPPGTGKSYVGTKIVKAILDQRGTRIGPILCVCYTNHALDQFLEGLVDEGVSLTDLVRVGSRSKSTGLGTRSLNQLRFADQKSRQEMHRFGQLRGQCQQIEDDVLRDFVSSSTTSGSFHRWIESNHPREYAEIVGQEDADGFQEQGQSKRDHMKRWQKWIHGDMRRWLELGSMWRLPLWEREAHVATWEEEWQATVLGSVHHYLDEYNENVTEIEAVNNATLLRILRANKVVGVTTTGCAIHQALIRALAPEIVVCEEAGEVLEAHLLACLSSATQQVIQIGDHLQLRPILNEYELGHEHPSGRYNLDVSMFERLVKERTDPQSGHVLPGSLVTLDVQRRMRPEICDLVRKTLYPSLLDGDKVLAYPATTKGFTHNLWFLDHDHPEDTGSLSCTNAIEAELLVELVAYAIKQGYRMDEITILTPYLGQLVEIRRLLASKNFRFALDDKDVAQLKAAGVDDAGDSDSDSDEAKPSINGRSSPHTVEVKSLRDCVRLSTVDNFQGNESPIVFISTVRCNNKGSVGFLKTFNRVNVMLSRAQCAMYMLGSASTVRRSKKADMFTNVLNILESTGAMGRTIGLRCQRHGTETYVSSASEIREKTPDGGCLVKCTHRLRCGHPCPKLCHADDPRHVAGLCMEPCLQLVTPCGNPCRARCYEACRCALVLPRVDLPCGHTLQNVPCHKAHSGAAAIRCPILVELRLPFCQHVARVPCREAQAIQRAMNDHDWSTLWEMNLQCTTPCGLVRDECQHECQRKCGECLATSLKRVTGAEDDFLILPPATKPAMELAAKRQTHAGTCTHVCGRALLCGHECTSACHPADQCPPCEAKCRNKCVHSQCSQPCKGACASCAEPCVWACEHAQGQCQLPCGSPCTRLPCDLRCSKLLPCGHPCPGLCGEPCLPSTYCRACPNGANRDQVVDLFMIATLAEHDPDDSPLVRLDCGHCFTVKTLDGVVGLIDFYGQNKRGEWTNAKPLQVPASDSRIKGCPNCRQPIAGVNRYSRAINSFHLYQSELKYLQVVRSEIAKSQASRSEEKLTVSTRNRLINAFRKRIDEPTPTQEASTKERSRLLLLGQDGDTLNLNSFRSIMQHSAVLATGIELLELVVDKLVRDKSLSAASARRTLEEAKEVERAMLAASAESSSQRSALRVVVLGMQLRVAFLSGGHAADEAERQRVKDQVTEGRDAIHRHQPSAPQETRLLATQLWETSQRVGHLSQAEKDEIFRVFAKGNDVYAQGFGGRWYQCPNGHPYVITECGGAMQRASCPECNAPIGGESHQLDATNTDARSFFTATT